MNNSFNRVSEKGLHSENDGIHPDKARCFCRAFSKSIADRALNRMFRPLSHMCPPVTQN